MSVPEAAAGVAAVDQPAAVRQVKIHALAADHGHRRAVARIDRGAVAAAAAHLDRDEIALLQHQIGLSVDRDAGDLPVERNPAGLAGFAALHAPGRDHHALDAGGQVHRGRKDAIGANRSVPAAMGACAAGPAANGLLFEADRVARLDHLDRRVGGVGQMHARRR
ncbi:hypothetical protein KXW36_000675, partial [Aspergillus fumigatus]